MGSGRVTIPLHTIAASAQVTREGVHNGEAGEAGSGRSPCRRLRGAVNIGRDEHGRQPGHGGAPSQPPTVTPPTAYTWNRRPTARTEEDPMAEMIQPSPVNADPEAERLHRKQMLVVAFHLFSKFGFDEGVAGHITARDPERLDHFWVNPFGLSFGLIRVADLILVNDHGEIVEGDGALNTAAFAIHSQVRRGPPRVSRRATPTPSTARRGRRSAASSIPSPRMPVPSMRTTGSSMTTPGVVLDTSEGKRIVYVLGDQKAVILRNHGLLTVGHSVEEAAWWFITMERSCQAQLLAEAAGTPIPISPDAARSTHEQVGPHVGGWFSFQPLLAKLLKAEPFCSTDRVCAGPGQAGFRCTGRCLTPPPPPPRHRPRWT